MKKKSAIIIFITLSVLMLACLLIIHLPGKAPTEQTAAAPQTTEASQQTPQQTAQPTAQQETVTQPQTQTTAQQTPQETAQPPAVTQPTVQQTTGEPQKGVYEVNAYKFIRLYKKPDTDSTIVTNIPNGTMLTIKSIEKDSSGAYWGRTEFKTRSGWVQMQDMKK